MTLASTLTGAGALTKSGTGTLTLSGANTYTGGTTINAGTLSVGADNNLGGAGGLTFGDGTLRYGAYFNSTCNITLNAGGGTLDTNGFDSVLSGIVGGAGSLTKNGTGTLTLSGVNTYSGGTSINVGTLMVGSDSSLGAAGGLTFGGGTLETFGGNSTLSGVISGSGGLTKAGIESLTLSGANTYSGATSVDLGTLRAGAANTFSSSSAMTVATGATLNLNNFAQSIASLAGSGAVSLGSATLTTGGDNTSTAFSGVLSGTGALTKGGTGTLTLSGANTYSGGTTVSAGTLAGNTTSLQGNIVNNAAVTFDQTANGTYAGVMGGTGSLTKAGTGTVTLSGANTYNGGTTVNAGTLSGDTTSLQGAITNNAMVTFDQTANGTYAGAISGTGGLTKSGTGKTILSGANTYTGDTNINGGILSVNGSVASNVSVASGGTLGGSGTIGGAVTVASGGIIAPGNSPGILTVNSLTLNSGSITRMEINGLTAGTEYDQIVVNNTATLGGTLDLVFGYTPSANSRFTLIRAGNIVSGFAAIQSNLGAALRASAIIDPTTFDILVALQQSDFLPFAQTHNQRSAASMLDAQFAAWGSTQLINRLNTLSAAQLPAVLGSLSGEQHTHGQSMARRLGTQFNSLLLSRLDVVDAERAHGWNFWLKGLGGFGRLDDDGNVGRADNHSGGFALGADTGLGDHALLGAAASYVRSNVDALTANLDMDSYQLSGYAKWHRDNNYIKGTLSAGFHQTGSRRTVFEDSASANYGSTTAGTALEAGRNIALLGHTTLTPYAGMQYQHLNRNNFTETGSDLANLKVREADEDSFRTLLGARLSQVVKAGWGVSIQPSVHAAWVHEHGDRVSRMAADFAAARLPPSTASTARNSTAAAPPSVPVWSRSLAKQRN